MSEAEASRWPSLSSEVIYLFIVVMHEETMTENDPRKKNLRTINSAAEEGRSRTNEKQQPMVNW